MGKQNLVMSKACPIFIVQNFFLHYIVLRTVMSLSKQNKWWNKKNRQKFYTVQTELI